MDITPFFPEWRNRFGPMGSRLKQTAKKIKALTLGQLENCFSPVIPAGTLPKASEGLNSRDRVYNQLLTFWCFLWQILTPKATTRLVTRQVQALYTLQKNPIRVSEEDGAFCLARKRFPLAALDKVLALTASKAQQIAERLKLLQGRPLKVVDGSFLTLADTLLNRRAYPKAKSQNMDTSFPLMRVVVIFSLASGAIVSMLTGNIHTAELRLFHLLMETLEKGDIMIADQGFGNYIALSLLQALGVDFIARSDRKFDGRKALKKLGQGDWLALWKRGKKPSAILTPEQWAQTPQQVTVRIVRGSCYQRGFRVRQVTLVTTLLDPVLYPAQEILQAYLRRWRMEMCFDDIKTTMGCETLRCKSPQMVEKEVRMFIIAHNLIRWLMIEASLQHGVELDGISFKGSVDALSQFSVAMAQATGKSQRQRLWAEMIRSIAADQLPYRPGRREPRAVKRQRKKYPHLNCPRHKFRDRMKRHDRRRLSRRRKLGLN